MRKGIEQYSWIWDLETMRMRFYMTAIALLGFVVIANVGQASDDYATFVNGGSVASTLDSLATTLDDQAEEIASLKSAMKNKVNTGSSASTMKVSGRVHAGTDGYGVLRGCCH